MRPLVLLLATAAAAQPSADEYERLHTNLPWVRWKVASEAKRLHKRAHSMVHVGGNHARARRARHAHIQSELERSVGEFVARDDGRAVARKLFGAELRDSAIFVIDGRLFATEKFIASSKKRGHAIMLSSTIRNGGLTNTAYAHVSGADGGATGPPCINGTGYEVPTTVIAKRSGYAQCGILVPNPYFGRGDLHGAWARQQDHIRQKSIHLNGTDPRVFWRGSCLNHENREGRLATNHPGKDEALTQEEKWGETTCSRDRGNRARMLGAALSVRRPDLFDVKCSRSAPPSDFSCVSGQERWEHDQARSSVVRNPAKVLDDAWVEPEDYARYQYLLNLPGETSGSYSRNLNHLRGGGVFRPPRRRRRRVTSASGVTSTPSTRRAVVE
jgi:hypothetical protein